MTAAEAMRLIPGRRSTTSTMRPQNRASRSPETTTRPTKGGPRMAWIYLIAAGLLEVVWSVALKQSQGFTRLLPAIVLIFLFTPIP